MDEAGQIQTAYAIALTSADVTLGAADTESWYVVNSDVTFDNRITVNGNVHLILADGCTLNTDSRGFSGGITVAESNSLTIYAQSTDENIMGKLTTTGRFYGAGIGGGDGDSGGTITINGGTVTATGGYFGAGIGGGRYGAGGTVTVSGGTVTAINGILAAGIGGNSGENGSFNTTESDNAVIFTNNISDQSGKADWSGVIFEGNSGQVYGETVTPTEGLHH